VARFEDLFQQGIDFLLVVEVDRVERKSPHRRYPVLSLIVHREPITAQDDPNDQMDS
jgi:hypothetical protein